MNENFEQQNNIKRETKSKENLNSSERENEQQMIDRISRFWFHDEEIVRLKKLVSKEFLESDELKEALKKKIKDTITGDYNQDFGITYIRTDHIKRLTEEFNICIDIINSEEIQEFVCSSFISHLADLESLAGGLKDVASVFELIVEKRKDDIIEETFLISLEDGCDYRDNMDTSETALKSKKTKKSSETNTEKWINYIINKDNYYNEKILYLKNKYNEHGEDFQNILNKTLIKYISDGSIFAFERRCEKLKINKKEKIQELDEKYNIIDIVKKKILQAFDREFAHYKTLLEYIKIMNIPEDFIKSKEMQSAIENNILRRRRIDIISLIDMVQKFYIRDEFIESEPVKNIIIKQIKEEFEGPYNLNEFSIKKCSKILHVDVFLIEDIIRNVINELSLTEDKRNYLFKIIDYLKAKKYKLDEFITQENVKQIAINMISSIRNFNTQEIIKIKNALSIDNHCFESIEIKTAIINQIKNSFKYSFSDPGFTLQECKNEFGIDQDIMNNIVADTLEERISNKNFYNISKMLDYFDNTTTNAIDIVEKIVALLLPQDIKNALDFTIMIISRYEVPKDRLKNIAKKEIQEFIVSGNIHNASIINENFLEPQERDPLLSKCFDIFGHNLNQEIYQGIKNLLENKIIDPCFEDIVKQTGVNGFNDLKKYINSFKQEIVDSNFNTEKVKNNKILIEYFKNYIRFEYSAWGNHGEKEFERLVDQDILLKGTKDTCLDLKPFYSNSDVIGVKKIDIEKQTNYEFPKSFKDSYNKLKESILRSIGLIEDKKSISDIIQTVKNKIESLIEELEKKREILNQDSNLSIAKNNIENKIQELKNLDLRSVVNFENNFQVLSKYEQLHNELREFVFFMSFKDHKNQISIAKDMLNIDNLDMNNISWMIDFVEHITHKETMIKYLKNKKSIEAFRSIIKTKALEDELNNIQRLSTKGTTEFKFIPTRGILMELSGHLADVCWASKYDCISKKFPNFTSITMDQNPDSKFERLSGSSMVIETESENDEKLLVIRGLNPIENVINQISVQDFVDKFIEYMKGIAKKADRKLVIIIDSCGGASTNRPVLFQYISNKYKKEDKKIVLKSSEDTTFNNHNIVNNCYLLE